MTISQVSGEEKDQKKKVEKKVTKRPEKMKPKTRLERLEGNGPTDYAFIHPDTGEIILKVCEKCHAHNKPYAAIKGYCYRCDWNLVEVIKAEEA